MSRHIATAPPLEEILRRHIKGNRLTLVRLENGDWQASANRGRDLSTWTCHVDPDPVNALLGALGPDYSSSWEKHLAPPAEDDWRDLI